MDVQLSKIQHLINRIHERSLRSVYNDTGTKLKELLRLSKGVSVHHKNIQILTTDGYKIVNEICPPIMRRSFSFRENIYNF